MPVVRDDFSAPTKKILASRVGYICSNPDCRKNTIGPGQNKNETVSIGVGAHISAAAPGGKRYDPTLTPAQRSDAENGLWLCQNCAKLIDSDDVKYTATLLAEWKNTAEQNAQQAIATNQSPVAVLQPYADPDLIWVTSARWQTGISSKNRDLLAKSGGRLHEFDVIRLYSFSWRYRFKIYNNSSVPLVNLKLTRKPGTPFFTNVDIIPKINNMPSLGDITLNAEKIISFEGTGMEAEPAMEPLFPPHLNGMQFLLEYQSENRTYYYADCTFQDGEFTVVHTSNRPNGY